MAASWMRRTRESRADILGVEETRAPCMMIASHWIWPRHSFRPTSSILIRDEAFCAREVRRRSVRMSFAPSWSRTVVYALPSEDHRDVDALVLRAGLDEDVDARLVGLRRDVDVPGRAALHALPILPDVIGPEGRLVEIGYLLKEARSISSSMGRLRHPPFKHCVGSIDIAHIH